MINFNILVLGISAVVLIILWAGNRTVTNRRKRALKRRLEEVLNGNR
jgi:hypothetical protein